MPSFIDNFIDNRKTPLHHPPTAKGNPITGLSRAFQDAPLAVMGQLFDTYGDLVRTQFLGPLYSYMTRHPDHYKQILQDNNRNYTKMPSPSFVVLEPTVGMGLLTNDGDSWLQQRRLAAPAFHRKRIAEFGRTMTAATLRMLDRWRTLEPGHLLDVEQEMAHLTLEIVGKTLFDVDLTGDADRVGEAFISLSRKTSMLTMRPFSTLTVKWPFWPSTRSLQRDIDVLDEVVWGVIRERRADPGDRGDLLSMFIAAEDSETGERMSDQQVRDEVMTMMLAGHETTSLALTWTFYLLSQHPDVLRRTRDEVDAVLGGRTPTMADVASLPYTTMVLQEAMRLYPPAYAIARYAQEADKLGAYDIPAGAILTLSTYHLHRHPEFWPDPDRFNPDRFAPEAVKARARYAYAPFGGGPRQCIGNQFAMTEATLILTTVLQHAEFALESGAVPEIEPLITLRPLHGMPLRVWRRENAPQTAS